MKPMGQSSAPPKSPAPTPPKPPASPETKSLGATKQGTSPISVNTPTPTPTPGTMPVTRGGRKRKKRRLTKKRVRN